MSWWLVGASLVGTVTAAEEAPCPGVCQPRHDRVGVRVDVGFAHWFSDRFRTAPQARSGSFGVGYRPADWYVEIYGRWEWSFLQTLPEDPLQDELDGRMVDFTSAGLGFVYPIHSGIQHVRIGASALAVMPHIAGAKRTVGFSGGFSTHLTFDLGRAFELGPFLDVREHTYRLRLPDGTQTVWQVDAALTLGLAAML